MNSIIHTKRIAFVGAGSMAEAVLRGLIERGITTPGQVFASNRQNEERLQELRERYGVEASCDPVVKRERISSADIVVLCMKPKDVEASFDELKPMLNGSQLLVSVIAGLTIRKIEILLDTQMPIVRTMPNTSSTIGLGATGMSFSESVSEEQQELATKMFEAVGMVTAVPEDYLEIVTGLSGSGPAYVYYFMEALIQAGIAGGLDENEARRLTMQTLLGAVHMVERTGEEPAELRRKVTSPNGSTLAALQTLDRYKFPEAVAAAVFSSAKRAKEMGAEIAPHIR
ncbi:pyrroline-5-carboxylate reductase [Paenibacillus chitinolyticus]|uniref:Pyrroline-5-carboxylate reductase n=1 Tax=Paenibacillus chitinolyticus TaxID=79263 RepID=A0A410WVJ7_9BACL|nr:pyrroline-5-carboxylate reductase [Paenibacillus chitinolyticus]MCY9589313.1 pyrroline-5-carboxylate reductase [Paenibacillus chitinolyticus]MCY9594386.1 pyrroline-5-carboxylate reductase [Paenibacillus chitinolyticus]QAV18364.1 pyrroline-5-carboxylate reductase [Paenibacillus chitinolyticus]